MNSVQLIGRLTRDPEVRYTPEGLAIAKFSIAIDRFTKNEETTTDFPNIVCFGKTAENVERFVSKGRQVGIQGRIQTGSYINKDGVKIYTTEVAADRVEFLGSKEAPAEQTAQPMQGFTTMDEDIPF